MSKAIFLFVILLFSVLTPVLTMAQVEEDEFDLEGEMEEEVEKKEVTPGVKLWYLYGEGAFVDSTRLDTLQDYFHIYHPVYKDKTTATFLGNYGTPAIDNHFFTRKHSSNYFFMQSREDYIFAPEELKYYNTRTPYTRLDFSQSENKSKNNETRLDVIHSQNINPYWNFTFLTNQEKSQGQYIYQEAKVKMVSLYTSYNKDNWNIYGGFLNSSVKNQENGGVVEDSLLLLNTDPQSWSVNLTNSESKFLNTSYFFTAEYRLGKRTEYEDGSNDFVPKAGIMYSMHYDRNRHEFYEDEEDSSFWQNTYYAEDYLNDSVRFNRLVNIFQLQQYEHPDKKYSFGKRAYLGYDISRGSMPGEYVDSVMHRKDIKYSDLYVGGGIFRRTGSFWKWHFDGKFYLIGRNAGQVELYGDISKPFTLFNDSANTISFTGEIVNKAPDYFQENYYSNHFRWDNSFDMEQRIVLGANLKMNDRRLEVGANYGILNNLLYNDTTGMPNQTKDEISVLSLYLDKDFVYRKLHFRTRLLWQKSSNEEFVHLPEWSAFLSTFYQFTVSKVLLTQIGADLRWNSSYYADAYEPATGLFYLQNETQYGNYPYIDVYASLRIKRTRVFFKWVNTSTNFIDGIYMTSPHYPMNGATFRLGVSWAFYD